MVYNDCRNFVGIVWRVFEEIKKSRKMAAFMAIFGLILAVLHIPDGCMSSQDWLVDGLMTTNVLTFSMVSNMFSVLDDNLIAALQFLLLILTGATSKSHGGTGNNFVFFCVLVVTCNVKEFGKVFRLAFEEGE